MSFVEAIQTDSTTDVTIASPAPGDHTDWDAYIFELSQCDVPPPLKWNFPGSKSGPLVPGPVLGSNGRCAGEPIEDGETKSTP